MMLQDMEKGAQPMRNFGLFATIILAIAVLPVIAMGCGHSAIHIPTPTPTSAATATPTPTPTPTVSSTPTPTVSSTPTTTVSSTPTPTVTSGLGVKFIQTATLGNILGDSTYINNSLTNNNPNAIVFVTQNYNPDRVDGTYNNQPIGVWYDDSVQEWAIFNQDNLADMPVDASFNVLIPATGTTVFVHTATLANSGGDSTYIDNPLTNNNPNAIVLVTQNYNPNGVGGTYNNHPIGVWYDGSKWAIFNQDLADMPVDASFNVLIPTTGTTVFVHTATLANSGGDSTYIDNPLTNNNPNAISSHRTITPTESAAHTITIPSGYGMTG
jgi:hypothetical protein